MLHKDSSVKLISIKNLIVYTGIYVIMLNCTMFPVHEHVLAAELTGLFVSPSSNIFSTNSSYEILFATSTNGTIKTIDIKFPSQFDIQFSKLLETEGIGAGSLSQSTDPHLNNSTLHYKVSSPGSVASGTFIKLTISNVTNPDTPGDSNTIQLTTRDTAGSTIDGPTDSKTFILQQ